MILVVDPSVLIGQLIRAAGQELLRDPELSLLLPTEQWSETEHELGRRVAAVARHHGRNNEDAVAMLQAARSPIEEGIIGIAPPQDYEHLEDIARRRVPRDQGDWPVVALALALDCGILTHDADFLGCGCPTWTAETVRSELRSG